MNTTTTLTLNTPLIEAALLALPSSRRRERYPVAIATLANALAENHIWNVDYKDAREEISRTIEDALRPVGTPIFRAIEALDEVNHTDRKHEHYNDISGSCAFNAAKGRAARLRKHASDLMAQIPMLDLYVRMLDEVALLNDAFVALKPVIVKGRKPLENPEPIDLSNTGICAICGNRQKLNGGMVHHGFRISDGRGNYIGQRMGKCFGVGYQPFELSCEANLDFRKYLAKELARVSGHLRSLEAGEVKQLDRTEWENVPGKGYVKVLKTYKLGEPKFADVLAMSIRETETTKEHIERDIEYQTLKINTWVRTPLYDELRPTA